MAVKASTSITLSAVVDVASCTRYYLLQSSTLSPPTKPTAKPPTGSWNDTEPTYTSGSTNSLYFCDLTVFSDGTWNYSSVSLSSAYEAAKEAYNKAQNAQTVAEKALSNTEIIVGTQTAATASWTGVASFASLTDGQQIVYWLPYAGKSNVTLNLTLSGGNTTGAIPCYYGGTTRLSTHYDAGNMIHLTYKVNAPIGANMYTGWWADANYNTNTNYYDRMNYKAEVAAAEAIAAGKLAVFNSEGKLILLSARPFDVTKPILYVNTAYTAANVNSGTRRSSNFTVTSSALSLANTVSGFTGTADAAVYIKGTLNGNMFTPASEVLTTAVPTAEDGYTYILLGLMGNSTTDAMLAPEHPMFRYYNGGFKAISQISYEAFLAAEDAQETADNNAQSIQRLDQSVSGLSTQFNVFSSGIEATIEDHSEILSAMSFSTDGLKIQMSGSIYYTLTDDVGYHIFQNDKEIAAFSEGKGKMDELQMGNIICRRTSKGGWVWTGVNS